MRRAPGQPHPVSAGGRRRPVVATQDRLNAPPPAIREFFVRDVDSVGLRRPTHFGASAYNWAYIFESVIVRHLESCLAGDLRVRRFVPESRDSLVSSESDSAALAPLLAPWTTGWSMFPRVCGKTKSSRRPKARGTIEPRGTGRWPLRVFDGTDPVTGDSRSPPMTVGTLNMTEARRRHSTDLHRLVPGPPFVHVLRSHS